jgi:hypothetical protein
VLAIRLQNEIAHTILRRGVDNRTQQRKAAPLAVDRVAPRRKRDVAPVAAPSLPNRKADELQSLEIPIFEVNFCFGELARRCAFVVRCDFHGHDALLHRLHGNGDTSAGPSLLSSESADVKGVTAGAATGARAAGWRRARDDN